MAISDILLVRYLLQGTRAVPTEIVWRENRPEAYLTQIRGVRVALGQAHSTIGSRLCMTLSLHDNIVSIEQPHGAGLFGRSYPSEDQRLLAELLHELASAARRQCVSRSRKAAEESETIRQNMYRYLLFGESAADPGG